MRILIAEDEPRAMRGLKNLITSISPDYQVVAEAADGRQALEMLKQQKPEVVFTDLKMPYMDGMALIRTAHALESPAEFVLVTAYEEFEVAREAIGLGVFDYLVKPITIEDAMRVLERLSTKLGGTQEHMAEMSLRDQYPEAHPLVRKTLHIIEENYASKLNQKEHLKLVTLLVYTLYGIPSVYYGSEFGIEGKKEQGSDWNLRPYLELSDFADTVEKNPVTALCAKLGAMKKQYPELTDGAYQELHLTNRQFAYGRVLDGSCMVTALNCDDNTAVLEFGVPVDGKVTDLLGCAENVRLQDGRLCVTLPANTGTVLYVGQRETEQADDGLWNAQPVSKTEMSTQPEGTVANQDTESVNGQENPVTACEDNENAQEDAAGKTEATQETVENAEAVESKAAQNVSGQAVVSTNTDTQNTPQIAGIILMTEDMGRMMDFYRNALGFEMEQQGSRAYCKKDDMVLTMVGRRDYERLTCRGYGYGGGVTNHFHLRILTGDVESLYQKCLGCGAQQVTGPAGNEWGEFTACVADPDGNIVEIVDR